MNADLNSQPTGISQPPAKIAILGGGLAGISAALRLSQTGHQVNLYESKQRLGGRAGSFQPKSGDQSTVDYCQHVGMGCCHALRNLIDMLGQRDCWSVHRHLHFYGPDGRYSRLEANRWLPPPLHIAHWLMRWPGLSLWDRVSVARCMRSLDKLDATAESPLDDLPALDWFRERGQSANALERFWATVVVSALGERLERVSLSAVAKVFQDGFMRESEAYHLWVPNRPLEELFSKRAQIALEAQSVRVHLGTPVDGVSRQVIAGRPRLSLQSNRKPANSTHYDHVVLAIPWHQLPRLSVTGCESPQTLTRITDGCAKIESSPISGIHTWWDRHWLPTPHATIVGRFCQWVFPKESSLTEDDTASGFSTARTQGSSESPSKQSPAYYQIVVSASHQLPPQDELPSVLQKDLSLVFPEAGKAKLMRVQAVTDPHSVFSVQPGMARLRPKFDALAASNIWLAGDWTATGWPATMEGAIRSGFAVADALSAHPPTA